MTPSQRVQKVFAPSSEVARIRQAPIRHRHPEFDENDASLNSIELNNGKQLSDEVRAQRTGAANEC